MGEEVSLPSIFGRFQGIVLFSANSLCIYSFYKATSLQFRGQPDVCGAGEIGRDCCCHSFDIAASLFPFSDRAANSLAFCMCVCVFSVYVCRRWGVA